MAAPPLLSLFLFLSFFRSMFVGLSIFLPLAFISNLFWSSFRHLSVPTISGFHCSLGGDKAAAPPCRNIHLPDVGGLTDLLPPACLARALLIWDSWAQYNFAVSTSVDGKAKAQAQIIRFVSSVRRGFFASESAFASVLSFSWPEGIGEPHSAVNSTGAKMVYLLPKVLKSAGVIDFQFSGFLFDKKIGKIGMQIGKQSFKVLITWVFCFVVLISWVICFVILISCWVCFSFSCIIICFPLTFCGGSLWVKFTRSIGFVYWRYGCLPFTRNFLFSILVGSIILTCVSVGMWLWWLFSGFMCWCFLSVSFRLLSIADGDSFVALGNQRVVSDIRRFGCLPFSRGFWWMDYPCLVSLACDYMVWLEKWGLCFMFWCGFSRSALPVSVHVIITWASDTSFDLRTIRTFIFVNATVVLAYILGMRVCFELVTMGVRYMVVDLLPLVSRLEFVFLKDHVFTTFSGLSPLLRWHLRFWFILGRSCGLRVSRFYLFLVVLVFCLLVLCFSFFGFGWTNLSNL